MPNRTIYISDADLPIFERAQQLAGENLSATIVAALRRFVEMKEQKQMGFEDYKVKVGQEVYRLEHFNGRYLARGRQLSADKRRVDVFDVYQTADGRVALHTCNIPAWASFGEYLREADTWRDKTDLNNPDYWQDRFTFEIFESLEQIREHIPAKLYEVVEQELTHDHVRGLDS